MGFAEEGDTDSYLARPDIVTEAIRQHKMGSIVTICWHAVPPTVEEPVTFRGMPGADSTKLASVQGQLLDEQYEELFTPGTELNTRWFAQMDTVAYFLKQLQEAKVPVLWRPYHEMNGNWFWWGGRTEGEYTTKAIYQTLFDRYVKHHKFTNLIWVWSVDRVSRPGMEFEKYYPGNEYLDMLALDVYGSDFAQSYYDGLMELSEGKPLVLGEVGNPPTAEVMNAQPNWAYWVVWAGMVRNTTPKEYANHVENPRVLFQEDEAYLSVLNSFRKKCKLAPLSPDETSYNGSWLLNPEKSKASRGFGNSAYKLEIVKLADELMDERTSIVEWADDKYSHDVYAATGVETNSVNDRGMPVVSKISWGENNELIIDSKILFPGGDEKREMTSNEIWSISDDGSLLLIKSTSKSPWGNQESELVYERN
ncbi:MAG: glycosyl hydrolase [Prolixibacteraceae bacterium]|jgi:mannan endo-1,4-beta-mannosidase|nr:glycosyl hydrolase [Prolixibacteraceae bacterium]